MFDHIPLPADDLNGIEETGPDTYTYQRKGSCCRPLLGDKQIPADNKNDKCRDHGRHRQYFPVILVDKYPHELAEVESDLSKPAPVSEISLHQNSPPLRSDRQKYCRSCSWRISR